MRSFFIFNCLLIPLVFVSGKSRLGEYYTGFGFGVVDEATNAFEGDNFNVFVNSLASEPMDFTFEYSYSGLETNSSRDTVWELGVGIRYHFDQFYDNQGMFRPFFGLGVNYLGDPASLLLEEDGLGWSIEAGAEISFTQSFSFLCFAELYGLWKDFQYNDFKIHSEFTWWMDEEHGLSVSYLRAVDPKVDYFLFKYLYSWR